MENNKIILNFIKANLKKDLNSTYDELGCAFTVNFICKNALGYVAGGGPSTSAMLTEIVSNQNFKEVTKNEARAGDIILSATGTGNGRIAHGHVGFLGENGIIYSNNSAKDMLDDHLTASDWKNYFVLKGGFPVRYFRAVGTPTIITPKVLPEVIQSSQNPANISLTIKSIVGLVLVLATQYGFKINEVEVNQAVEQLTVIIPSIMIIWGIIRKYIK